MKNEKKKQFEFKVTDKRGMSDDPGTKIVTEEGVIQGRYADVKEVAEDKDLAPLSRYLFETDHINPGPMRVSVIPVNKEKLMVKQKNGIVGAPSPTQGIIAKVIGINKFATKAIESGVKIGSYVVCSTQVGSHIHTSDGEVWTIYELDILNIFNDYPDGEETNS